MSHEVRDTDNRDLGQMVEFQQARIEALQRCVRELKEENAKLKAEALYVPEGSWRDTWEQQLERMR